MASIADFYFTKDHEWAEELDDGNIRVGITEYAAAELGDIVFVELPEVGDSVTAGESFGSIESVKAVSDLYAPVSGTVVQVNEALEDQPELVNESPFEEGWMVVIEPEDKGELDGLMSHADYEDYLGEIS